MRWRLPATGLRTGRSFLLMSRRRDEGGEITGGSRNAGEGLYVSVLLRPDISAVTPSTDSTGCGTGCSGSDRAAVAEVAVDLRWPNDLLIGARKDGGILVESKTEAAGLAFAVIGIGINVHQRDFDAGALDACYLARYRMPGAPSAGRRCLLPC